MIKRRKSYLNKVADNSISLFYSGFKQHKTNDQFFPFSVNRNFFYLTNIEQENVVLVLAKGNLKTEEYLFIEKVDPIKALWDGATLTFEEAHSLSNIPLKNIIDINELDNFLFKQLNSSRDNKFGQISNVYFDLAVYGIDLPQTKESLVANNYQEKYPHLNILNNNDILAEMRMVKDQDEVNKTIEAIKITNEALNHLMSKLKPNKFENELEAEFNYVLNTNNVKPSFSTIVAGGKNGTILHYVNNDQKLNDGELVLFDLGVDYFNYCSDISRTYPINGKFSPRQKEIYEIVLKANKETIKWLKPGVTMDEFKQYGKQILIDELKRIGLIKEDSEIEKYYYHGLGHYLGLDIHDVGNNHLPIPVGAIVTVEPGLYIAEENIGIRIEDDILITEDGNINLSESIIKEVEDIEKFMSKKTEK